MSETHDPATYATYPTFLGLRSASRAAAFTIAGVPLDLGTTNRSGTRFGPAAIRVASRMLVDGAHPDSGFDPRTLDLADIGDFQPVIGDIAASHRQIEAAAQGLAHLIALGGDHSMTLPLMRALCARTGPIGLIHFDAHVDTWSDNFGQVLAHGSPFYHGIKEGLVDPKRHIILGARSPSGTETMSWTKDQGVTVLSAEDIHLSALDAVVARVRQVVGQGPTYLTFDIDSLDPSAAPGTGTPEIGGLFSWQARAILRRLTGINWVGMDVVEVAPAYDVSEITALAAAHMVFEYLCLQG